MSIFGELFGDRGGLLGFGDTSDDLTDPESNQTSVTKFASGVEEGGAAPPMAGNEANAWNAMTGGQYGAQYPGALRADGSTVTPSSSGSGALVAGAAAALGLLALARRGRR